MVRSLWGLAERLALFALALRILMLGVLGELDRYLHPKYAGLAVAGALVALVLSAWGLARGTSEGHPLRALLLGLLALGAFLVPPVTLGMQDLLVPFAGGTP